MSGLWWSQWAAAGGLHIKQPLTQRDGGDTSNDSTPHGGGWDPDVYASLVFSCTQKPDLLYVLYLYIWCLLVYTKNRLIILVISIHLVSSCVHKNQTYNTHYIYTSGVFLCTQKQYIWVISRSKTCKHGPRGVEFNITLEPVSNVLPTMGHLFIVLFCLKGCMCFLRLSYGEMKFPFSKQL